MARWQHGSMSRVTTSRFRLHRGVLGVLLPTLVPALALMSPFVACCLCLLCCCHAASSNQGDLASCCRCEREYQRGEGRIVCRSSFSLALRLTYGSQRHGGTTARHASHHTHLYTHAIRTQRRPTHSFIRHPSISQSTSYPYSLPYCSSPAPSTPRHIRHTRHTRHTRSRQSRPRRDLRTPTHEHSVTDSQPLSPPRRPYAIHQCPTLDTGSRHNDAPPDLCLTT